MESTKIKEEVRKRYGQVAKKADEEAASCCGPPTSCCGTTSLADAVGEKIGYSKDELDAVPDGANLGLGCGNPVALASLEAGETVLDLGSGAGFDCFLAAQRVGETGHVIGVDMTAEMLAKARANAEKGGYTNVEFREGEIESLPVDDNSVDIIISNCVINLSPDKNKVFGEAHRALKPGGRIMVSDLVLLEEPPKELRESVAMYSACVGGALLKEDYLEAIRSAGFHDVEILSETTYPMDLFSSDPIFQTLLESAEDPEAFIAQAQASVVSIKVRAIK